jgi:chemotaxis protein methyltransferase CheR
MIQNRRFRLNRSQSLERGVFQQSDPALAHKRAPAPRVSKKSVYPSALRYFNPEGVVEQSPGLAAFFAANPGISVRKPATLERVAYGAWYSTLSGLGGRHSGNPAVGRKRRGQPWALLRDPVGVARLFRHPRTRRNPTGNGCVWSRENRLHTRTNLPWGVSDNDDKRHASVILIRFLAKQFRVRSFVGEGTMQDKRFSHIRFASSLTDGDRRRSKRAPGKRKAASADKPPESAPTLSSEAKEFLDWLFAQGGVERSLYRDPPLHRRLSACLRALRVGTLHEARELLGSDTRLQVLALDSLLIGVSEFFRDEAVFSRLRLEVIPSLLQSRDIIRVWSSGCSDGSELYSVALILAERGALHRAQLIGTDCRESAVRRARLGIYDARAVRKLLPQWGAWLKPEKLGYRIAEDVREGARFEQQDIFSKSPPGDFDLVLCRNLAIYLRPAASQLLWQRAAAALCPEGLLVTGKAERAEEESLVRVGPSLYRKKGGR